MRIAIVNEGSTKNRNTEIMEALDGFNHTFINAGMKNVEDEPDLSYLETGIISAILLNLKAVDFVIGGCGTGQGFATVVLQFPKVFCGIIFDPLDMFLYSQINAGNCISLVLNKGYGNLGGKLNLRMIFEQLFSVPFGKGYPEPRRAIQIASRQKLENLSIIAHRKCIDILKDFDKDVLSRVLKFPNILNIIKETSVDLHTDEAELKEFLIDFSKKNI